MKLSTDALGLGVGVCANIRYARPQSGDDSSDAAANPVNLTTTLKEWPNGPLAVRWAAVMIATGVVLPYLACLLGFGLVLIFSTGDEAVQRVQGLVFPSLGQWKNVIDQLLVQLPPFLVQAAVAARLLGKADPGAATRRQEYRIGGCLIGLSIAAFFSFVIVATTHGAWVRPGMGVPVVLILSYYLGGLVLGLIGGWYGKRLARRRVKGNRARNPVLRGG